MVLETSHLYHYMYKSDFRVSVFSQFCFTCEKLNYSYINSIPHPILNSILKFPFNFRFRIPLGGRHLQPISLSIHPSIHPIFHHSTVHVCFVILKLISGFRTVTEVKLKLFPHPSSFILHGFACFSIWKTLTQYEFTLNFIVFVWLGLFCLWLDLRCRLVDKPE